MDVLIANFTPGFDPGWLVYDQRIADPAVPIIFV
jgi:hypothetical protein